MNKNQKGFSAVEGLLIVIILGLICFTGWYVWNAKSNADKSLDTATSTTAIAQNKGTTTNTSLLSEYKDALYSFMYLKTWSVNATHDQYNTVNVQSTDYKEDRAVTNQRGNSYLPSSGFKLIVSEIPSDAPNSTFDQLTSYTANEEKTLGGGSHKKITVNGHDALWVNNNYDDT